MCIGTHSNSSRLAKGAGIAIVPTVVEPAEEVLHTYCL